MKKKGLHRGDLVTPLSTTPIWKVPGESSVGELRMRQIALVLSTRVDPRVGWVEVEIFHDGVVGWVLDEHLRKVRPHGDL